MKLLLLLLLLLAAMTREAAWQESGWTSGLLNSVFVDCDCGYAPSAFGCGSCCDHVVSDSCSYFDLFVGDFGCGCNSSASPRTTSADLGTCCCCCSATCGAVIASRIATGFGDVSLISCVSGRQTACATSTLTGLETVAGEGCCPRSQRPQVTVTLLSPLRHLHSAPCHDHAQIACQQRCLMIQQRLAPPPWGQLTQQAPLTKEPRMVELQRKGHRSHRCCRRGPMWRLASSKLPLRLKRLCPPHLLPPLPQRLPPPCWGHQTPPLKNLLHCFAAKSALALAAQCPSPRAPAASKPPSTATCLLAVALAGSIVSLTTSEPRGKTGADHDFHCGAWIGRGHAVVHPLNGLGHAARDPSNDHGPGAIHPSNDHGPSDVDPSNALDHVGEPLAPRVPSCSSRCLRPPGVFVAVEELGHQRGCFSQLFLPSPGFRSCSDC